MTNIEGIMQKNGRIREMNEYNNQMRAYNVDEIYVVEIHQRQLYQKQMRIRDDHRLYTKYVPASYGFIRLSDEQEKQPNGIINMPMNEKHSLLVSKMMEAFVTPTHNTSLESTQTN